MLSRRAFGRLPIRPPLAFVENPLDEVEVLILLVSFLRFRGLCHDACDCAGICVSGGLVLSLLNGRRMQTRRSGGARIWGDAQGRVCN